MAISWHSAYVRLTAYLSLAISGLITVAWLAHITAIVKFLPSSVPMHFSASLCFLLLCIAVIALHHGCARLALLLSAVSSLFAAAVGLEYLLQQDLGIDNLFVGLLSDPLIAISRMAPNTALGLLLLGIGMIASVCPKQPKAPFVALIAFSLAGALGIVPLLGYLSGVETAYGWANFVNMSVTSALLLSLLGSAMIVHIWLQLKTTKLWLPWPVSLGLMVAAISLTHAVHTQEQRAVRNIVKSSVALAAHETQEDLKEFDKALARIAHRWELGGNTPEKVWRGDAQQYLTDYSFLAALITLDAKNNLKWFESKLNEAVFNPLPDMPELHEAIQQALTTHQPQDGGLLALPNHHYLLLRVYPLVHGTVADGTMLAFIAIDALFKEVNEIVVHEPVAITVQTGGEELYHVGDLDPLNSFSAESIHNSMPGWQWSMSATPEMMAVHTSRLPWVVLGIGLLMTLFVTTTLYLLLRQQRDALKVKEGKARLRAVFQNAADGITLIDRQGNIEEFNPACEAMFGYQKEEVIGKNVKILMPEPYHHEHDGYLDHYEKTGERRIIGMGRDVRGRHKDGSTFDIDLRVSEVHLPDRKLYMGMFHNITDRKQAEATQQQLINKLAESNTELERFAYVASHDLREPLRIVTNFSSLLRKEYGDVLTQEAKEYIHVIHESAARMHGMVSDLLEYARIGNEEKRFVPVDMEREFQHVQENLSAFIAEHRAILTHDALPSVPGNPVQLMRLLQNLVGNAIKFHEADIAPQVHVSATDEGDVWEFCVRDNGIGMATEYTQQIFEPFRQLHGRHEYSGTGIGLAICKRIVEKHRGKIWVESTLGGGSQFYFTLPKMT